MSRLKEIVEAELAGCKLEAVGGYATKMYLRNEDIELVAAAEQTAIDASMSKVELMKAIARVVQKHPDKYTNLSLNSQSKSPVFRFVVIELNTAFEVHFGRTDLLREAQQMEKNLQDSPEIRFLMFFMMVFLRQRDLNNSSQGGVGLFLLHCMVLSFFRHHRAKIQETRGRPDVSNALLSEYCLKMLEFYGLHFDCAKQKIVLGDGGKILEKSSKDNAFSLVCPQIDGSDIGVSAFRVKEVFNCLKNRYFFLTNYNFVPGESVLKYLVNPSKVNFSVYLK